MMDAQKTIQLTMEEIKTLRESLLEKVSVLEQFEDQIGKGNQLETIRRVLDKIEK